MLLIDHRASVPVKYGLKLNHDADCYYCVIGLLFILFYHQICSDMVENIWSLTFIVHLRPHQRVADSKPYFF